MGSGAIGPLPLAVVPSFNNGISLSKWVISTAGCPKWQKDMQAERRPLPAKEPLLGIRESRSSFC